VNYGLGHSPEGLGQARPIVAICERRNLLQSMGVRVRDTKPETWIATPMVTQGVFFQSSIYFTSCICSRASLYTPNFFATGFSVG